MSGIGTKRTLTGMVRNVRFQGQSRHTPSFSASLRRGDSCAAAQTHAYGNHQNNKFALYPWSSQVGTARVGPPRETGSVALRPPFMRDGSAVDLYQVMKHHEKEASTGLAARRR